MVGYDDCRPCSDFSQVLAQPRSEVANADPSLLHFRSLGSIDSGCAPAPRCGRPARSIARDDIPVPRLQDSRRVLLPGSSVVGAGSCRLHRCASPPARPDHPASRGSAWGRHRALASKARPTSTAWQPTASGSVRTPDPSAWARPVSASYSRVDSLAHGTIRRASFRPQALLLSTDSGSRDTPIPCSGWLRARARPGRRRAR